MFQHKQYDIVV